MTRWICKMNEITIALLTKDSRLVTKLNAEFNPAIFIMADRGVPPEIIMWGSRLFILSDYKKIKQEALKNVVDLIYKEGLLVTAF